MEISIKSSNFATRYVHARVMCMQNYYNTLTIAMKKAFLLFVFTIITAAATMAAEKSITVSVTNPISIARQDVPVTIEIDDDWNEELRGGIRSAFVTFNGKEIPCQLDDFDGDAEYDELCFLTDMTEKEKQQFTVTFSNEGSPRVYKSRVYGCLNIRDRAAKNQKHLPILSLTVPPASNPYQYVFPHGPLLESELVGFRIYCDHRQSVDYYGHRNKQLELEQTQFYPTKEQKSTTHGDDVLYTGTTYGCGTMHGWNGKTSVMFEDVRSRTYSLIATGPLRTIIETVNRGWRVTPDARPVDVRTRYILYAGHRDVMVDVDFSRDVADLQLSTGVTDIVGSESFTDKNGLRACWGTALAGKNTKVYDVHTVGLAVCVPKKYYDGDSYFTNGKETLPDQAYVALLKTRTDNLHYWFTATCDMENFGFKDSKAWFDYLKEWKKGVSAPVKVTITRNKK